MPLTNTETRNFQGLYLQQNSFDVPDGAFEEAMNVQIQSDGIISKTRGFYTYYTPPGPNEEIKGLYEFQDTLLCAFPTEMAFFSDDSSLDPLSPVGVRTDLTGDFFSISFLGQSRSAKQNLNLYFTTDYNVMKLESATGKVRKSGVPPGLDLAVEVGTAATGPLPSDSQSGYRAVFGRRDENGNLLLGTPSDIATLGIPADGTGLTYSSTGVGPYTVTVTVPSNTGFLVGQQIIVTAATDPDANGTQTITALSGINGIRYSTAANPGSGTLDIAFSRTSRLTAAIPSEIDDVTDGWFIRWYRTTASAGLAVSPTPDFALIGETILTQEDIDNAYVYFDDDVDPTLVGAQLYTNPNSREGETQGNARPPAAYDITLYNTYMIYANVELRQFIALQLIDPVLPSAPYEFKIKLGATTETFLGDATGVRNRTTAATSVAGVGTVTITYNAHGASNGWTVYISDVTGTVPRGTYVVSGVTVNTFNITAGLLDTATALDFEFVTNGTSGVFYQNNSSSSVAQEIADTAYYLVKSINRTSNLFYANYVSTFDDAPGKIRISTKDVDPFHNMSVADDNAAPAVNNWLPPIPNSFASGVQIYAENHTINDTIYFSKTDEPEAVPVVNFIRIGSKNKAIKRIFALRDCLVILKEDGAFVLTGQTIADFNVSTLDSTVYFTSDRTADKINNTVIALSSNQGLVQVTEKSVQIISRRMDDVVQPLLGFNDALSVSLGFGYESGRTYYLSINLEVLGRTPQSFMYNVLNQTWTESDNTFRQMVVGPSDVLYGTTITEDNVIIRQRKSQTLVDFSREFMTGVALANADLISGYITLGVGGTAFVPSEGDVVVYNEVITRIRTADLVVGTTYLLTFAATTNIPLIGVDVIVYQGFTSTVKMAPFHAGAVGREKQFSAFQLHLRQNSISEINLSWGGAYFGSSEDVDWAASISSGTGSSGWGFEPWGLFPWGLADSIRLIPGTTSGSIIRTWLPKFAARTTYIQAIMNHRQACELMLIQALVYSVRGYADRTSR